MSRGTDGKRVEGRFEVIGLLADRWSPRSFLEQAVETVKIGSLFEAARLAPSAHNTQPPRFILAERQRRSAYDDLLGCLSEANQVWARTAPALILASAMRRRYSAIEGDMVPYPHAVHDLGLAVMSMIVQAEAVGLSCHPMGGFDPDLARERFGVPSLFEPLVVIAVGYRGSPDLLPPELRRRELGRRSRRPLEELVFEGAWGRPAAFLAETER
jgi:nitroreductase